MFLFVPCIVPQSIIFFIKFLDAMRYFFLSKSFIKFDKEMGHQKLKLDN